MPASKQTLQEHADDAAQQYVSSEELVNAISAAEGRQQAETADRLTIGEAIRQIGLDLSPEQLYAEVRAQRLKEAAITGRSQNLRSRKRVRMAVIASVLAALMFVTIVLTAALRASHRQAMMYAVHATTGYGAEFDSLMNTFRSNTFDDGKVEFVKMMSKNRAFKTDQVRLILSEMTFDKGREQAGVVLYPHVTDKDNFYQVFETFTFDEGRKNLMKRLGLN